MKQTGKRQKSKNGRGFIGVIDSGLGGLSVWREIVHLLPAEKTVYFADQAHVPYGDRSLEEVRSFAEGIARFLIGRGSSLVILACNTMSAPALRHLRRVFPDTPFVGMEPAIKPAVERTRSGVVGVIATRATFQGELFADLVDRYAGNARVIHQTCPGLVEAVESGALDDPATEKLVKKYLQPILNAGADQLALGCTHYPFLLPVIKKVAAGRLEIIDPAPAVARQAKRIIEGLKKAGEKRHTVKESGDWRCRRLFITTGKVTLFRRMLRRLLPALPEEDIRVKKISWKSVNSLPPGGRSACGSPGA